MDTKKYNGWTNYATWRIALEMFDGYTAEDLNPNVEKATKEDCKEYVETYLEDMTCGREPMAYIGGWANAFLADVNWQEIADHMNDEVMEDVGETKHISSVLDELGILT